MSIFHGLILAGLLALPTQALAGAWPRAQGEVFLSFSATHYTKPEEFDGTAAALYLEYGGTEQLTFGLDATLARGGGTDEAFVFLRRAIGGDGPHRFALTLALGQEAPDGGEDALLARVGGHWGHGLARGWLAADGYATWNMYGGSPDLKADFTWGHRATDRLSLVGQIQTGEAADGEFYANFAPSLVWALSEEKTTWVEFGVVQGIDGSDDQGVLLGLWRKF